MRILFRVILVISAFTCGRVLAELNEAQVLEHVMHQPHIQAMLSARMEQAIGRRAAAGRWDNPTFEYSQENLDLPTGQGEESSIWLRQRLDVWGAKGFEKKAAEHQLAATKAELELKQRQIRARVSTLFYTILAEKKRVESLVSQQARLQQITSRIKQRVERGDASRYDLLRAEQDFIRISSERVSAQAGLDAAQDRLFSLLDLVPQAISGELVPPSDNNLSTDQILIQNPQLVALSAKKASAEFEAKAARRGAWPEFTLGVGRKEVDEPDLTASGNTIALGVEIPLFDRGQGYSQIAASRAREHQADFALLSTQLRSDLRALRMRLNAERQAALDFRSVFQNRSQSLSAIAEASYHAGEISIMELLDAYNTELGAVLAATERALAARLTYIELQTLESK